MNLYKTSFLSALFTIIKMSASIITTKIIAILVGPAGLAVLGTFTNFASVFSSLANGSISAGITKYISEYDSIVKKNNVVLHALLLNLICSFIVGVFIIVFSNGLSIIVINDYSLHLVFKVLGMSIVIFGVNLSLTAILNGYRMINQLVFVGISGSVLSVLLAFLITIRFGIIGALINVIIVQIFVFSLNIYIFNKKSLVNFRVPDFRIDRNLLIKLLKYSAMGLSTIIAIPASAIIIRNYIITYFSLEEAGYVQGIWDISTAYLTIITTSLSVYYLPTLSNLKSQESLKSEIFKGYKLLIPISVGCAVIIFAFRGVIINLLYTPEFHKMNDYFLFQLIGDIFKMSSFLLGYICVAKALTRRYIAIEISFSISYIILSLLFMRYFGSIGVTYAYTLNSLLSLMLLTFLFRKLLFER